MGFHEDDRIRAKNRVHNEAYEIVEGLRELKYTSGDIVRYAEFAMKSTSDSNRIEIYHEMIRISGRSNEKVNSDS